MADNFDANISSPNGIKATHALALLLTQMQVNKPDDMNLETARPPTIRRLNKNDMKEAIVQQVQVSHYNDPKEARYARTIRYSRSYSIEDTRPTVYHIAEGTSARPRVSSEDNL